MCWWDFKMTTKKTPKRTEYKITWNVYSYLTLHSSTHVMQNIFMYKIHSVSTFHKNNRNNKSKLQYNTRQRLNCVNIVLSFFNQIKKNQMSDSHYKYNSYTSYYLTMYQKRRHRLITLILNENYWQKSNKAEL